MKEYKITEEQIKEAWLPIYKYEYFYEVSNFGRVKSLCRNASHSSGTGFRPVSEKNIISIFKSTRIFKGYVI